MEIQTAEIVFFCVMGVAITVWAVGLYMALRLGHQSEDSGHWQASSNTPIDPSNPWQSTWGHVDSFQSHVVGTQTVPGNANDVSRGIASRLSETGIPGRFSGLFEITDCTPKTVVATKVGPLVCNQPTGLYFSEAKFDLRDSGNGQVSVEYRLGFERLRHLLKRVALGLILGLGLPVMGIIASVIWFFVVHSNTPAVRWQVLQSLHVIHVLWPPFLIMWFYSAGRRHCRTYVANLLRSLDTSTI